MLTLRRGNWADYYRFIFCTEFRTAIRVAVGVFSFDHQQQEWQETG